MRIRNRESSVGGGLRWGGNPLLSFEQILSINVLKKKNNVVASSSLSILKSIVSNWVTLNVTRLLQLR